MCEQLSAHLRIKVEDLMQPSALVTDNRRSSLEPAIASHVTPVDGTDSLFERVAWLYAFCREHLFRDDTKRMVSALWPTQTPGDGTRVIELGCGPGFYSRKLARRFPQIIATGIDRS